MSSRPLLLGHRGARSVKAIPENTCLSFDLALAHGSDGFEFDVRLTADDEAVVCHDATAGGVEIARASSQSLPQLPRLRDVLIRYQHRAFLDIELKVGGLENITLTMLRDYAPSRGYVVSSFLPEVLRAFHSEDSSVPLGLICETTPQLNEWRHIAVTHVILHQRLALLSTIRELQGVGKKVLVWTVNSPSAMLRLAKWGVDGIVSDQTEKLAPTFLQSRKPGSAV